jgi:hypothetical protein
MEMRSIKFFLVFFLASNAASAIDVNTHCGTNEATVFSCKIEEKIVSICAFPKKPPFSSIEYRFGEKNSLEITYVASKKNKKNFFYYIEPAGPKALINEVWFNRDEYRYMVSQCIGGDCAHDAGLIVYKNLEPILVKSCGTTSRKYDFFNQKIIQFGSDFSDSRSFADLLKPHEEGNEFDTLYPYGKVN